ncbi:TolC family protein [Lentisphaera profundi]|uniref:TolC family protein n=1 Tax=Lentisphaera profundi TaxID=1658616 RepID=A0ABY7VZ75_9BACT|nr:TolC family protein [Lentisphaera profundi]WDE98515.1 TolC family protein [Lentisphaera profundi]
MKNTFMALSATLAMVSCGNMKDVETKQINKKNEISKSVENDAKADFTSKSPFKINKDWWQAFDDPTLNDLILQAVDQNLDLKLLVKRVDLARLAVSDAQFDKIPKLSSSISQPGSTSSDDGNFKSRSKFNAHVSWEADIWGRLEAASRGALAEYKATEADYRGAYLKVINDMANIYFNIRMLDEQQSLHEWAIKDTEEILRMYVNREKIGLANKEQASSQKAEVLRLKSDLVNIERQREVLAMQLNLLLGRAPHAITLEHQKMTQSISIPEPPKELSFSLISRRPDVIAADLRLREAYFNEESARVARLPQVSVGLDYTMSSASLASITDNWVLSVLPKISFPALDPATKVELERRGVFVESKQIEYKKSLLSAVNDVEEAIMNIKYRRQQLAIEKERTNQLEVSYQQTMKRFETGLISHLEVFEVERTLINSKQRYLDNYREVLSQTSKVFISLGGGW